MRHSLCGGVVRQDVEYRFYCEFQSHEPEFDYLKSLEIEERINKIRWCKGRAGPLFLLSTNDKTIKLWKIYEKKVRMVTSRSAAHPKTPPRGGGTC
jgi:serine/threonine-protein phosphatase 2A regulatory subunit B